MNKPLRKNLQNIDRCKTVHFSVCTVRAAEVEKKITFKDTYSVRNLHMQIAKMQ